MENSFHQISKSESERCGMNIIKHIECKKGRRFCLPKLIKRPGRKEMYLLEYVTMET
jgi:hypothetical protein